MRLLNRDSTSFLQFHDKALPMASDCRVFYNCGRLEIIQMLLTFSRFSLSFFLSVTFSHHSVQQCGEPTDTSFGRNQKKNGRQICKEIKVKDGNNSFSFYSFVVWKKYWFAQDDSEPNKILRAFLVYFCLFLSPRGIV